jgi:hypothetical protein
LNEAAIGANLFSWPYAKKNPAFSRRASLSYGSVAHNDAEFSKEHKVSDDHNLSDESAENQAPIQENDSPFVQAYQGFAALGFHPIALLDGFFPSREALIKYAEDGASDDQVEAWERWRNASLGAALGSPVGDDKVLVALHIKAGRKAVFEAAHEWLPNSPTIVNDDGYSEIWFYKADPALRTMECRLGSETIFSLLTRGDGVALPSFDGTGDSELSISVE